MNKRSLDRMTNPATEVNFLDRCRTSVKINSTPGNLRKRSSNLAGKLFDDDKIYKQKTDSVRDKMLEERQKMQEFAQELDIDLDFEAKPSK
mmetsp:Transcript_6945/g.6116  ORF Transcript_6945/g.6116 Transcript_6945/m.6116 type:complete len:91 (-) Transcript_6945:784-1056(-)